MLRSMGAAEKLDFARAFGPLREIFADDVQRRAAAAPAFLAVVRTLLEFSPEGAGDMDFLDAMCPVEDREDVINELSLAFSVLLSSGNPSVRRAVRAEHGPAFARDFDEQMDRLTLWCAAAIKAMRAKHEAHLARARELNEGTHDFRDDLPEEERARVTEETGLSLEQFERWCGGEKFPGLP